MTPLRILSFVVISGLGLTQLNYSIDEKSTPLKHQDLEIKPSTLTQSNTLVSETLKDEKFTFLKYQDLELKQPTFDTLLSESNLFASGILKVGLESLYQKWPLTLEYFLPKDSFLMDLVFQYSNPFFTYFIQNQNLPQKLDTIIFLKSQGISFSSNDVSQITDKEISDAKNKVIASFFSHITDEQLQRFYGTIITEGFHIEGLKDNDSRKAFQTRINSLNKKEKTYKVQIDKQKGRAFKLKDQAPKSINLMPLLETPIGKYFVLETTTLFGAFRDVHKIKKIQLASLSQVQKHRVAMKAKLIETLGTTLYDIKKADVSKPIQLSSDLPIIKMEIQTYNTITELVGQYFKIGSNNLDSSLYRFIQELIKYSNEESKFISIEEIKKDRNGVRLFTLINTICNELLSPIMLSFERTKDFFAIERIRPLEVLKEVQYPASMHLLLAQLYQKSKQSEAQNEIKEYLKKGGLSHVSYLPLTNKLVEERSQKVQTVLNNLKNIPEELKALFNQSKSEALLKTK